MSPSLPSRPHRSAPSRYSHGHSVGRLPQTLARDQVGVHVLPRARLDDLDPLHPETPDTRAVSIPLDADTPTDTTNKHTVCAQRLGEGQQGRHGDTLPAARVRWERRYERKTLADGTNNGVTSLAGEPLIDAAPGYGEGEFTLPERAWGEERASGEQSTSGGRGSGHRSGRAAVPHSCCSRDQAGVMLYTRLHEFTAPEPVFGEHPVFSYVWHDRSAGVTADMAQRGVAIHNTTWHKAASCSGARKQC